MQARFWRAHRCAVKRERSEEKPSRHAQGRAVEVQRAVAALLGKTEETRAEQRERRSELLQGDMIEAA